MPTRSYAILEAPSTLGLATDGVERLPERLLELGLADRIHARRAGQLPVPAKDPIPDPSTGILNAKTIAAWSPQLADAVEAVLDAGQFPVVLGGDCTILLGSMLALKRRGRYGLLFIDGNADFFQPEAEPNGEGASMDLAWTTGHGPKLLTDIEGRGPLVRSMDVVAFGYRDHEDQKEYRSQPLPEELEALDLPAVRAMGIEAAASKAVAHLTRPGLDGFFIHLDADVLDDAIMPAVDFRVAGGLSRDELSIALRIALTSGRTIGLEATIYNPSLAMLHSFVFHGGRVSYANQFLRSCSYREAVESGRISRSEFGTDPCRTLFGRIAAFFKPRLTDNANVSINKLGDEVVAFTETPLPIRFDPSTLQTLQVFEYQSELRGQLSIAHPHLDFRRKCSYRP